VVAGFAAAALLFRGTRHEAPKATVAVIPAPAGSALPAVVLPPKPPVNPAAQEGPRAAVSASPRGVPGQPDEKTLRLLRKPLAEARANERRRESQQLLAAGFTPERIEWILRRKDELREQRARDSAERVRQGLADPFVGRFLLDGDLQLRDEIGDEEYTRIREATGRPTAVAVKTVQPGSNAEAAGLRTGDEIVSYAGKRVFNFYDLAKVAAENTSGSVPVEIRRNGQKMQVTMSSGEVGISRDSFKDALKVGGAKP
jgi:C-terminal processing protease CtpA/Prc